MTSCFAVLVVYVMIQYWMGCANKKANGTKSVAMA